MPGKELLTDHELCQGKAEVQCVKLCKETNTPFAPMVKET